MIRDVAQMLVDAPDDEPRSRLDPYRAQILRWRRRGKSYRRIQRILAERCNLPVATMTLYEFVQRRLREQPEVELPISQMELPSETTEQPKRRLTFEERMAQADLIRAIRNKPVVVAEPVKPRFEFDASKPLTFLTEP